MTKTQKAINLAKKKNGITKVDFDKIFAAGSASRTISTYFKAKGTKMVNGREYTNYVAR